MSSGGNYVFGCMLWYQGGGNGLCYMFLPHGLPLIIHPNLISLWITLAFLCDNRSVGRVLCAITFVIFINGYSFLLIHFFAISQVCITKIIFSFLQMYYTYRGLYSMTVFWKKLKWLEISLCEINLKCLNETNESRTCYDAKAPSWLEKLMFARQIIILNITVTRYVNHLTKKRIRNFLLQILTSLRENFILGCYTLIKSYFCPYNL